MVTGGISGNTDPECCAAVAALVNGPAQPGNSLATPSPNPHHRCHRGREQEDGGRLGYVREGCLYIGTECRIELSELAAGEYRPVVSCQDDEVFEIYSPVHVEVPPDEPYVTASAVVVGQDHQVRKVHCSVEIGIAREAARNPHDRDRVTP